MADLRGTLEHFARQMFGDDASVVVDDASHWVHADKPEQFRALLREFITSDC